MRAVVELPPNQSSRQPESKQGCCSRLGNSSHRRHILNSNRETGPEFGGGVDECERSKCARQLHDSIALAGVLQECVGGGHKQSATTKTAVTAREDGYRRAKAQVCAVQTNNCQDRVQD